MIYDDVIDIQIFNKKIMQIKRVSFNLNAIEKAIVNMPYLGQGREKDDNVENAKLPSIAKVFYECIFDGNLPSPELLCKSYLDKHFKNIGDGNVKLKGMDDTYRCSGVKARVYRAFPSLLRDFHFYTLCETSKKFDTVNYSFLTDTQKGIDLLVVYKGIEFAVSLFVDTQRSKRFKERKYKRHDYTPYKEVCIGIDPFDKKNYVGDYALYGEEHIKYLISEMERIISEDVNTPLDSAMETYAAL